MSGTGTAWAVGGTHGKKKRIHRGDCKYAKNPYNWAGNRSERELFDALVKSGSAWWHDAGQCCSGHLDRALYWATRKNPTPDYLDHYINKLSIEPALVVSS